MTIRQRNIRSSAVASRHIALDTIVASDIASGSVDTDEIADGALAASAAGRLKVATSFFNAATVADKFAADSLDVANLVQLVADGAFAANAAARALIASGFFDASTVTDKFAAGAIGGTRLTSGTVGSDRLTNPQNWDPGVAGQSRLYVAANVADGETVTVGSDVYQFEQMDTDSTDDTAGGDFNNTTNPLTVVGFTTNYPNVSAVVGKLIRIQSEILRITAEVAGDVTFQRGASGTTNATHADALDVFHVANALTGTIMTGVNGVTPILFTPAIAADINTVGTANVRASSPTVGGTETLLVANADAPGGNLIGSAAAVATTETLLGGNNVWSDADTSLGRAAAARRTSFMQVVVDTVDVTAGGIAVVFPFTVSNFVFQVRSSAGLLKTVSDLVVGGGGGLITLDIDGATNVVNGDTVTFWATE